MSIALYVGAIAYNVVVSAPRQRRLAEVGRSPASGGPHDPASAGAAELARLVKQAERDGKAMGVIVIAIVFLMVVKPSIGI